MATIGEVAEALAETVAFPTRLEVTDYVPGDFNVPALFVSLNRLKVVTMGLGSVDMWFDCVVFTSRTVDLVGQRELYEYLSVTGTKSIVKAIFDKSTLGLEGVSASPISDESRALGIEEVAAYGYFGGIVPVLVATDGA